MMQKPKSVLMLEEIMRKIEFNNEDDILLLFNLTNEISFESFGDSSFFCLIERDSNL